MSVRRCCPAGSPSTLVRLPNVTTTCITGTAGFIGEELVKLLVTRGHSEVYTSVFRVQLRCLDAVDDHHRPPARGAFFSFNPSCSCSAVNTDDTVIPEQVTARWASVPAVLDPDRSDRLE